MWRMTWRAWQVILDTSCDSIRLKTRGYTLSRMTWHALGGGPYEPVRGPHIDNMHEIYAALLYMKQDADPATAGYDKVREPTETISSKLYSSRATGAF